MRSGFTLLPVICVGIVTAAATSGNEGFEHNPELTEDGLEFSINRQDFKIDQFQLYGRTFDDNFGFAEQSSLPLDNRGYAEV
jgi:hypothetical protein